MASQMTSPVSRLRRWGGDDAHRCPCLPDTGRKMQHCSAALEVEIALYRARGSLLVGKQPPGRSDRLRRTRPRSWTVP